MSLHRFFVAPDQIQNECVRLSGGQAHQICKVLRLSKGDHILVLDNRGWQYELVLTEIESSRVVGTVLLKQLSPTEPTVHITLYQSLLKRDNFEWVLQKGTELGITSFVPILTQRTVVRQNSLRENKLTRWQRILSEAAEQSGRGQIPKLAQPVTFQAALQEASSDFSIIPWENERANHIAAAFARAKPFAGQSDIPRISLLIGPEGGFSSDEIDQALTSGITPVTLGPRILRAETAAIVAATLVLHELGELK
ncbi:MAG: 16S rRNA (uracil(1498)-N(3))-methyltransferase [Candidatus Promineifilaceae bacterium]|nr:16S rRNA (uracil(1498)-N(3))-methyltransferase [Candidatus Promineifilaceae bacterium]